MKKFNFQILFIIIICLIIISCNNNPSSNMKKSTAADLLLPTPDSYVAVTHPEWSKNSNIYEVNIRQYSPKGDFKGFEKHLKRLKAMGVDILWIMPIHPIRKEKP